MQSKNNYLIWDKLGIIFSSICIVHCLAMPFLSAYLLILGMSLGSEELTHRILLLILAGIGLLAFIPGMQKHKNKKVLALATIGFIIITLIAFFGSLLTKQWEILINMSGSILLIGAHWFNHTLTRKITCCDHKSH